jgi:mRNA-degrading endonuclease RelE of RelBE toxin-antitoxin system
VFSEAFHPKVKSDLRKLDKKVAVEIRDVHLNRILDNPAIGSYLRGRLSHIRSYHFRHHSTEYRIAYEVIQEGKILFYYMVASRENFYKKLEQRIG